MAVLQKIRGIFFTGPEEAETVIPAPATTYDIHPLTTDNLKEVWKLNQRCFHKGENYPRFTISYLLSDLNTLSYCAVTPAKEIVGFVFITSIENGTGHITTIGTAPEHRRRGLARRLLLHAENALKNRDIYTVCLEVRVSNFGAQNLYRELDYAVVQRLSNYYSNGEDGYLMVKSLA